MGKFKVVDRVRRVIDEHMGMRVGNEAIVTKLLSYRHVELDKFSGQHSDDCLELIPSTPEPHPAIRTVTRREIVPGVYGARGEVTVGKAGTSTMVKITIDSPMSKNHLREAAHLFNQIAEVLEEG